jgi:formaldehyde-activating enzyme involved in methanogenesis
MKLFDGNFQAIWTVDFNDSESEKHSKIFVNNYKTFTDAIEATINQYPSKQKMSDDGRHD